MTRGRPARGWLAVGAVLGIAAVFVSITGMVEALHQRWVVADVLSLGQVLLLLALVGAGYLAALRTPAGPVVVLAGGGVAGGVAGMCLAGFVVVGAAVNLRAMFVNASPTLFELLRMGREVPSAAVWLVLGGAVFGLLGSLAYLLPLGLRRPLLWGVWSILLLSLFQDLLQLVLQAEGLPARVSEFVFAAQGLTTAGAVSGGAAAAVAVALWRQRAAAVGSRVAALPPAGRFAIRLVLVGVGIAALALLPIAGGSFIAQVLVIVGLYTLMGLGLNLEVGFAGLLDLGFVAFFAIGAYTVGLLTSVGELGIAQWSFWTAVPVAVLVSLIAGVILGIPVLGIRGDYLAIATLGFGEIVRLLVLSDALRPWLGGSQGLLAIPKPTIGGFELVGPEHLFYLTLVSSAVVAYVAWRLRDSRLGRAWMAIREDEDVAQALGINLVSVKLLAYGLGAAFAGVGGAIFAVMVGSVFPHSFQLLISINVLALIIVGGIGSIPGVIVGAAALVGLPELLREFGEFRFLVYGALLVAMMLLRPEGLWPAAQQQRELHEVGEEPQVVAAEPAPEPALAAAETQVGG
ncbi:MAG: branched-chain amino acid ABC transporter permease [Armatimonadota bacterium]|nr:branched-chain amino acid ABC transporter permease [Armatimonadota bacterium]MDR5696826.1 branched-chain amino acid ABC transporter permease [Armatimonadota bacterium]